jgi:hypothetical protein
LTVLSLALDVEASRSAKKNQKVRFEVERKFLEIEMEPGTS